MPDCWFDHLIFAVSNLADALDEFEALLGVRPVIGGKHPAFGTHNALLGLGSKTYLELMAIDPEVTEPPGGYGFSMKPGVHGLHAWAMGTNNIEIQRKLYLAAGVDPGQILPGKRSKPDGSTLSWSLSDPRKLPMDGICPFLIDWGATDHPAASLPQAGELRKLVLTHPNTALLEDVLAGTELEEIEIQLGNAGMEAHILTPAGLRVLKSI